MVNENVRLQLNIIKVSYEKIKTNYATLNGNAETILTIEELLEKINDSVDEIWKCLNEEKN